MITISTSFVRHACASVIIWYLFITVESTPSQDKQYSSGNGLGDTGSTRNNDNSSEETDNESCENRGNQCQGTGSPVPECRPIRRYLRGQRGNVQIQRCCRQQSNQSFCNVSCNEGFSGVNVTYLCNITADDCAPVNGQEIMCERGLFVPDVYMYYYCYDNDN